MNQNVDYYNPKSDEDHYKTLGLTNNATEEEIKTAFKRLILECHPGINAKPDAEENFEKITAAYVALCNKAKRMARSRPNSCNLPPTSYVKKMFRLKKHHPLELMMNQISSFETIRLLEEAAKTENPDIEALLLAVNTKNGVNKISREQVEFFLQNAPYNMIHQKLDRERYTMILDAIELEKDPNIESLLEKLNSDPSKEAISKEQLIWSVSEMKSQDIRFIRFLAGKKDYEEYGYDGASERGFHASDLGIDLKAILTSIGMFANPNDKF